MTTFRTTLLAIAKEPLPGRVKTHLTPPHTPEEAAEPTTASLPQTPRTASADGAQRMAGGAP